MYFYIVNPAAGGGRMGKIEAKLLAELKRHDILGDWSKTTGRSDVVTLTKDAVKRNFHSIVIVGGDGTFSEALNDLGGADVAIGVIPLGRSNEVASLIGVNSWKSAPAVLSARRLEEIRPGRVGSRLFIHNIVVERPGEMHLTVDGAYTVSGSFKKAVIERLFDEERFLATLTTENGSVTSFKAEELKSNEPLEAKVDNVEWKGPLTVSLDSKIIRIIVGRERIISHRN